MPKARRKTLSPKSPLSPKLIITVLITLIIGFAGGIGFSNYFPSQREQTYPDQATVSRVIDGDTLELESGKNVRLYGISCPDKDIPFYQEAKTFTQNQVAGKKIILKYQPNYQEDKFGRLLGYVFIHDQNLNVELVRQGFCKPVIYQKRAKLIYQDELLEAQENAKEEKVGVWGD